MPDDTLLRLSLMTAVPMWQMDIRGWSAEKRAERSGICSQVIAEKGDIIQFRAKKKGATADAFNRMAEGVALLSFAPGGVRIFGMHFEANPEGEG